MQLKLLDRTGCGQDLQNAGPIAVEAMELLDKLPDTMAAFRPNVDNPQDTLAEQEIP